MFPIFLAVLFTYVVCAPALVTYFLWRHVRFFQSRIPFEGLRSELFRAIWGFFYEPYKLRYYFWTLYSLVRRVLFISITIFAGSRTL